jgi:hypothetical protein
VVTEPPDVAPRLRDLRRRGPTLVAGHLFAAFRHLLVLLGGQNQ